MLGNTASAVTLTSTSCPLLETTCSPALTPICPTAYVDCTTKHLVHATPATRCGPVCTANSAERTYMPIAACAAAAAATAAAVLMC